MHENQNAYTHILSLVCDDEKEAKDESPQVDLPLVEVAGRTHDGVVKEEHILTMIRRSFSLSDVSVKQHSRPSLKTGPEDNDAHANSTHASAPDKFCPVVSSEIPEIEHRSKGYLHEGKVDQRHKDMLSVPFLNVDHDVEIEHGFSKEP